MKQIRKRCEHQGCTITPVFDIKGGKGRFCKTHKTPEMIDVLTKRCNEEGCDSLNPVYNIQGGKGKFCSIHKTPDMVNVKVKYCEHIGCTIIPNFDVKGGKGRFCSEHKTSSMVDVKNKRCKHVGCMSINPNFDVQGGKGCFCSKHKLSNMINVKGKRCEQVECTKYPSFDIKGGKGRFCKTHKTPEMIDVKNKRCEINGCTTLNPIFDTKGGKGSFCIKHKTLEMIDVKNKRCEFIGCQSTNPCFNIKGENGKFCSIHKSPTMINVKDKQCEYEGCIIFPNFDFKDGKGRFCKKHKLKDMIDIKHKICDQEGCESRPYYGKPGSCSTHCAQHKQPGMIVRPTAKCINCKNKAMWGTVSKLIHCELHKTEEDINLVEKACISCGLSYILNKENKCEFCNPISFKSAHFSKQNALMNYLDARDLKGCSTDLMIEKGECGKERPDRIYDIGDKIIILECDEHQHKDRQCLCEQTRMVNIGQSFGGTPVYFIRWNPDKYITSNSKQEIIGKRHTLVGDFINSIINRKSTLPVALVSVFYMYYDGWNTHADESWEIITPFLRV